MVEHLLFLGVQLMLQEGKNLPITRCLPKSIVGVSWEGAVWDVLALRADDVLHPARRHVHVLSDLVMRGLASEIFQELFAGTVDRSDLGDLSLAHVREVLVLRVVTNRTAQRVLNVRVELCLSVRIVRLERTDHVLVDLGLERSFRDGRRLVLAHLPLNDRFVHTEKRSKVLRLLTVLLPSGEMLHLQLVPFLSRPLLELFEFFDRVHGGLLLSHFSGRSVRTRSIRVGGAEAYLRRSGVRDSYPGASK